MSNRNNPDRTIWECPVCLGINVWDWDDADRASRLLKTEVKVAYRILSPREKIIQKAVEDFYSREFDVTVKYYLNMPSIITEKTVTVDALYEEQAEEKVRKMFPHITSLTVVSKDLEKGRK